MDQDDDQSSRHKVGQNKCQTLKFVVHTERVHGFQDDREDGPDKRYHGNDTSESVASGQTIVELVADKSLSLFNPRKLC